MKYYLPNLRLATQLGPQQGLEDKLGGNPWGLPTAQWPVCSECDEAMAFVAQFSHHKDRLDLGRDGRVVFVFQCHNYDTVCDTWDPSGGANAAFIVEPETLNDAPTAPPGELFYVLPEARVIEWMEKQDQVTPEQLPLFNDDEYLDIDEDVLHSIPALTKLGSAPSWIQYPEVEDGFKVIAQFSDGYFFFTDVPSPDDVGCEVTRRVDGQFQTLECTTPSEGAPEHVYEWHEHRYGVIWGCDGPNFGDGGLGYLLMEIKDDASLPACTFLWQCT